MARSKFAIFLALVLVGALAYFLLTTDRSSDMVLIGTVDSNQVIVSSKIPGRIEKLLVDEGTVVKQGDAIAVLDSAELEAQQRAAEATLASLRSRVAESRATEQMTRGATTSEVATAEARAQSARSQWGEAQADLERVRQDSARIISLAEQGIASQQDRDRAAAALKAQQARVQALQDQVRAAEADIRAAQARTHQAAAAQSTVEATRAQMASAEAQRAEAQARLGYTQIVAPVAGTVSVRAAREGEVVNPGTPIVTIVDLNDTWVRAAVPETYADAVRLGDRLKVRLPSGRELEGKVIFKAVEGDFATQRDVSRRKRDIKTFVLKVAVDNSDQALAPGLTANVLVPRDKLTTAQTAAGRPAAK
jgi:HlyD family secretion protein